MWPPFQLSWPFGLIFKPEYRRIYGKWKWSVSAVSVRQKVGCLNYSFWFCRMLRINDEAADLPKRGGGTCPGINNACTLTSLLERRKNEYLQNAPEHYHLRCRLCLLSRVITVGVGWATSERKGLGEDIWEGFSSSLQHLLTLTIHESDKPQKMHIKPNECQ